VSRSHSLKRVPVIASLEAILPNSKHLGCMSFHRAKAGWVRKSYVTTVRKGRYPYLDAVFRDYSLYRKIVVPLDTERNKMIPRSDTNEGVFLDVFGARFYMEQCT